MKKIKFSTPRYFFEEGEYLMFTIAIHLQQYTLKRFCEEVLHMTYRTFRRRIVKGFFEDEYNNMMKALIQSKDYKEGELFTLDLFAGNKAIRYKNRHC